MGRYGIKDLKKVKKDRFTWTGQIALFSTVLCIICAVVCVKAIKGSNVDFLKDSKTLEMPSLIGLTQQECVELGYTNDLNINFIKTPSNKVKSGVILYQSVDSGKSVTNNQTIDVKVSSGAEIVQVPNTIGQNVNDAKEILNNLGLNYKIVYTISNNDDATENLDKTNSDKDKSDKESEVKIDAQTVVKSEPKEFSEVKDDDTITLYVERPYISTIRVVPSNLYGKTWNEAVKLMDSANISNYKIFYIASDGEYGKVVSVWPKGVISLDDTVYIKVSGGPLYGTT